MTMDWDGDEGAGLGRPGFDTVEHTLFHPTIGPAVGPAGLRGLTDVRGDAR
ncbi:MAG: hypothetical protein KQH57_11560 [Actinomycetales bacterium]|nr:hypothetical protein [Actinomycetales bacterium]